MTGTQIAERKSVANAVYTMDDENFARLVEYMEFLRFLEKQEDAEDLAYAKAHKDDPAIPLEQALKEIGIK